MTGAAAGGSRRLQVTGSLGFGAGFSALFLATLWMPGSLTYPTDYPQFMLAGIAVLFFAAAGLAAREAEAATEPAREADAAPGGGWALAASILLCIAYVASWTYIGFYVATPIFIALQLWALGQRRPLILIVVPVATTLLVWGVFSWLLSMSFPAGVLFGSP